MKTKHTPGPWTAEIGKIHDSVFGFSIESEQKIVPICSTGVYTTHLGVPVFDERNKEWLPSDIDQRFLSSEAEANARLIAAAPEMAHFILEMADRYPNSEWISGEAKRILTKAGIQP